MSKQQVIRSKIRSIQNTKKITLAMQLVAASKLKKTQDAMLCARPYKNEIQKLLIHLVQQGDLSHSLLQEREPNAILYLVFSSKRGLCGGLNNNLFKQVVKDIIAQQAAGRRVLVVPVGSKAINFFKHADVDIPLSLDHMDDTPSLEDLIALLGVIIDMYESCVVDRIVFAFNVFKNAITQQPILEQLIPLQHEKFSSQMTHETSYIFDENSSDLLNIILIRYLESVLYQAVLENYTSEQAARMVAMKAATDNAQRFIQDLRLRYNKARQASITQEIIEIISGASAVSC